MVLFIISIAIILLAIAFYIYLKWNSLFWKKRGVTGPSPHLIVGNTPNIYTQKKHMLFDFHEIYKAYRNDEDFVGIFNGRQPALLILNPQLIRRVLVTDFSNFHDNEFSQWIDKKSDPIFGLNPFVLTNSEWKEVRSEIVAGLTINRIKNMYPVTKLVCDKLTDYISKESKIACGSGLDTKELCLRFTSELVTDAVLGLKAESFTEKPTPILGMIHKLFEQPFWFVVIFLIANIAPFILKFKKIRFIPKSVENFFVNLVQTAIDMRKTYPDRDRIDFLNYMLQLQEKKNLSTTTITSHTMTFLLDGFETTAGTIAHCLLMIARYPKVQAKLLEEIREHFPGDTDVEFDKLNDVPYVEACIHETLRMFPPGFIGSKMCTKPIEFTSKTGKTVTLRKGDIVNLPEYSVMNDEEYFPNPQEFIPERFSEENGGEKKYREMGLYYGFSDGPRICLGMRFALTQAKASIVAIIRKFNIRVNPKTRSDNEWDTKHFLPRLLGGVWLDFEERI